MLKKKKAKENKNAKWTIVPTLVSHALTKIKGMKKDTSENEKERGRDSAVLLKDCNSSRS